MLLRAPLALVLAVLACAAGCGGEADPPPVDLAAELRAPGPHAVGYRSLPVTYMHPISGAPRTVEVLVWYPAQAVPRGDHPLYLLRVSQVAVTDAPALELGALPVVVFSHGHQAYASVMGDLMEHYASHGFLAIAPMHTGNTFADGADRQTEIYHLRAHDVGAALDQLATGGPALVVGHSFGGYTAYALGGARYDLDTLTAACGAGTGPSAFCSSFSETEAAQFRPGLRDERLKAVFAIDSGDFDLFGASGVGALSVPVLHMVASQSVAGGDRYWDALTTPARTRVVLKDGAHNDFTDSCGAGAAIQCSALPAAQVLPMVRAYGLAFARASLLGDTAVEPVLRGELEVSSGVEVSASR